METQAPPSNAENRLAISYIRYSSLAQGAGDSERRQIEAAERYCKTHNLILTDKFKLHDRGKSGWKGTHRSETGALGQLEKQLEGGLIPKGTTLIVENLDRLSRQEHTTALKLLLNLLDGGLEIVALSDNERRYTKESVNANIMELMASVMVLSRGHEESQIKSYRSKANWSQKKKAAAQGQQIKMALHGWLRMENGKYELIKEKAETIKRIFKLYLSGYGASTIAESLRRNKTPITTREQKKTGEWLFSTVLRIIKCKAVTGCYTGVIPEIPDYFPRVISDSDYYTAQSMRKARVTYKGQRSLNPFVFSHLLKCSKCGQSMTRTVQAGYTYLRCMGYNAGKCDSSYMEYKNTEKGLLNVIGKLDESFTGLDETGAIESQKELVVLQGRLNELDERIKTASAILSENFTQAGNQVLLDYETTRAKIANEIEMKKNVVYLSDHRKDWREVKARIESGILSTENEYNPETGKWASIVTLQRKPIPDGWKVRPYSVIKQGDDIKFIPHEKNEVEQDFIVLRESLRVYIERVDIDIEKKHACIVLKNGKRVNVWFRHSHTYPRKYSYKTVDSDWQEIKTA